MNEQQIQNLINLGLLVIAFISLNFAFGSAIATGVIAIACYLKDSERP